MGWPGGVKAELLLMVLKVFNHKIGQVHCKVLSPSHTAAAKALDRLWLAANNFDWLLQLIMLVCRYLFQQATGTLDCDVSSS